MSEDDQCKEEIPPSRAVAVPLKGGGLIMFSCTAKMADEMDRRLSRGLNKPATASEAAE